MRTILFLLITLALGCSYSCTEPASSGKPNVLLIVADDLGYADMSCTGLTDDVSTPNLDKLASSGTRFTRAYATSPICSPSRGGLITGCYQQRWGTYWYGGPGLHDSTYVTIPELLKKEGYQTGYVGKVHYGHHDSDTTHRSFPLNHGFDYYFGHTSPRKHYLSHKQENENQFLAIKKKYQRKGQSMRQEALWDNTNKCDTMAFATTLFAVKASSFIEKHKEHPFFLQLSFNAVHNFTHQLPEAYLKAHQLPAMEDWDPAKEKYYTWYERGRYPNNPNGRAYYLGQLHYMDEAIGQVMQTLKNNNLQENTIVVFISDNGGSTPIYANNTPLRGSKYVLHEGGIRVPMMIAYPKAYQPNQNSNNMVSAMDILPTICKAIGIDIPKHIDGIDLTPLLTGANQNIEHDTLYWYTKMEMAIATPQWKYHKAMKDYDAKYEMVELELGEFLYKIESDVSEKEDVKATQPEKFNELKTSLNNWLERTKNSR